MKKKFIKRLLISWISMVLIVSACDNDSRMAGVAEKKNYQTKRLIEEDKTAEFVRITGSGPVSSSGQPIQDALNLLLLDADKLRRRQAYEQGYIMLARLPLIDYLSQSPFKLQRWADDMSHAFQDSATRSLADTFSIVADALGGNVADHSASGNGTEVNVNTLEAYLYLCKKFGWTPHKPDLHNLKNVGFNSVFDRQIGQLVYHLADAALLAAEAYSELSSKELELLTSSPERFFYPHNSQFNFLTAPTHVQVEIVSIVRKIKFDALFAAFAGVSKALDAFSQFLDQDAREYPAAANFFFDGKTRSGTVLTLPSPIGDIVILGQDDNEFRGGAALVIDLGGNDQYPESIGFGPSMGGRLSISVDIAGNDAYGDVDSRMSQGVGIASIGLLADFGGDDHYIAGDMAQGCGLFGIGVLMDTLGNDIYEMGLMGQGFGVFGIGILSDRSGKDHYTIGGMGQGVGSTMGFGVLIDGNGDDQYRAEWAPGRSPLKPDIWSHAQGVGISIRSPDWRRNFSLYGGVGFLSDGSGDDTYHCSGGNCMGAGYFMSVGSLVDHSGNDRYDPKSGNGMGFAVHLASGVLIDKEGDDQYFARNHSGGVGADRSVGLLADYQGNDIYGPVLFDSTEKMARRNLNTDIDQNKNFNTPHEDLAVSSYASASRSQGLGLLIDYNGDDRYFSQRDIRSASCGAVIPPPEPQNWSHAILIDLGGTDIHNSGDRKNNSYRIDLYHGLFYDVDLQNGKNEIQGMASTIVALNQGNDYLQEASIPAALKAELLLLAGNDNFYRFGSIGRIVRSKPVIIDDMVDVLSFSQHGGLNLSLIEALNHYILKKQMTRDRTRHFEGLLKARDPDVRSYAARTLGWWNVNQSGDAVISALADTDPEVRANVIWAIGRLGRLEDLKVLRETVVSESSKRCKRQAVQSFHQILSKTKLDDITIRREVQQALLNWIIDPDPIVRNDAAVGLRFVGATKEVIRALKVTLKDEDIYVKRASAKSLALIGQKQGLPVLIDSLTFPSIDTAEYYDQDLVKDLAYFCGTDFTGEIRYEYLTWKKWWAQHGHEVDIDENLAIMKTIETAFAQENEKEGMRILDHLLTEHPENIVIKFRFKKFCQDWITYRLLAQEKITRKTLERCLHLQKKIVELSPDDPKSMSELAGFFARLSRLDDAVAVMTSAVELAPDNLKYREALSYYKSLKKSHNARKQ